MYDLSWGGSSGEVHLAPLPGEPLTPCCNRGISELHDGDSLTDIPDEVTCPVSWSGRLIPSSSLMRAIRSRGETEGSQEKLLKVRARIVRASSSEMNSKTREELLRLLDGEA
jgi:hypothetical protein